MLRMTMGMERSMAGSVVRGCSTLAPKYASSHASLYDMLLRHTAPGTCGRAGGAGDVSHTVIHSVVQAAQRGTFGARASTDSCAPIIVIIA